MRYDEQREVYRDCRWCQGKGCVSCKIEADKDYKAQFPNGPVPIATFEGDAAKKFITDVLGDASMAEMVGQATRRAEDRFSKIRHLAVPLMSHATEAEMVDALVPAKFEEVLVERIKQFDAEQHARELTGT